MSHCVRINTIVEVEPKHLASEPELIAESFLGMDASDQAKFFNHIAASVKSWDMANGFYLQMLFVVDEKALTDEGKEIMKDIGSAAVAKLRTT